jgi:tRNA pseudouridine 55 synthase
MIRSLSSRERKALFKGVFAVNKIKNSTSVEVLEKIKEMLLKSITPTIKPLDLKVGHGGTLDHTATGVLVVGIGLGCKILPKLLHGHKRYHVTGKFGTATDTYNETGKVIKECQYDHIRREMLEQELKKFRGIILQTPPLYSALKMKGKRVADLTRAGVPVKLDSRPVACHLVQCVDFSPPYFSLDVHCGGGFYVRSLVHDLGNLLQSCAHVQQLHRYQQGPFSEQDMLDSHEWTLDHILQAIDEANLKYGSYLKKRTYVLNNLVM